MFDPSTMTDEQLAEFGYPPRHPPAPVLFAQAEQPYSSMERASYKAARALVVAINARLFPFPPAVDMPRPMGGGVLPGDDETGNSTPTTGLFQPPFAGWFGAAVPTAFGATVGPDGTKYYPLHMRFKNGAVINVGLFLDKLSRFPLSQEYAVNYLAAQVEAAGGR